MNPLRLFLVIVAGCVLSLSQPLHAQAPPWTPDKQFSSDQEVTTKDGRKITMKVYIDNGKMRSETSANGMNIVAIARPDQKKLYSVMAAQKMVMVMPLSDAQMQQMAAATGGGDSSSKRSGPTRSMASPARSTR